MESRRRLFDKLSEYFREKVKLSFVSDRNIIIATNDDKVYEFDQDDSQKLSLIALSSDQSIVKKSIEGLIVEELCYKNVIEFKNSYYHTIARTTDGKFCCWGWNKWGLIGNGRDDDSYKVRKPELNKYLTEKQVSDICCGFSHSLVLTADGQVYTWGDNRYGQIGNASDNDYQLMPYHVNKFNGEKIKSISCGETHSLALTEKGNVFSWGFNEYGQLGLGIQERTCNSPKLLKLNGILTEKISCGFQHSLLLSLDGSIYVFGNNNCRELGTNVEGEKQFVPKKLETESKFVDIASHCDYQFSVALSMNQTYYIWGKSLREVISEPKETPFKSFDEVFAYHLRVTYKTTVGPVISFNDNFIRNGEYESEFKEVGKLGNGSYGEVFKVTVEWDHSEFYAIKKIRFTNSKESEFLKELNSSSFIMKLSDERLVQYLDIWLERESSKISSGFDNMTLYIQMELCDKTLGKIMDELTSDLNLADRSTGTLTVLGFYIASQLFIEILKGVNILHIQNPSIIHRDLKPDNILLKTETDGEVCVKIGDFGLIAIHEYAHKMIGQTENRVHRSSAQSHTSSRGQLEYMAPEVENGEKYNMKADIFSLGVILQELFKVDNYGYHKNIENENLHLLKYQAIYELSNEMTANAYDKRPDCEDILSRREIWALNTNELKESISYKSLMEKLADSNSFLYSFITTHYYST